MCFRPYSEMPNLCKKKSSCYKGNYNTHVLKLLQWQNAMKSSQADSCIRPFKSANISETIFISITRFLISCQPIQISLQLQWPHRNFQPNAQNSHTSKLHNYTTIMMQVLCLWFQGLWKKKIMVLIYSLVIQRPVAYRGGVWGVQTSPKIPMALQNCAKLTPNVKTVKNCWI